MKVNTVLLKSHSLFAFVMCVLTVQSGAWSGERKSRAIAVVVLPESSNRSAFRHRVYNNEHAL